MTDDYLDHLNYEDFEEPVVLRLKGTVEETMLLPGYDVKNLVREHYGVPESGIDVAKAIEENRTEIAFDAVHVEDVDDVFAGAREMVDNYNEPPDIVSEEVKREWRRKQVLIKAFKNP